MNLIRFNRLWKRAISEPAPRDEIVGPWEGFWRSEPTGHDGRLRCVVRGVKDGRLDAAFHAIYWKVFRITYEPALRCELREDARYEIAGSWNLGLWMGEFRYEGEVTPTSFEARYRSSGDHGVFEMERPS